MMDFEDHNIPDEAFTEDELEAGVQHLLRGAKPSSAPASSSGLNSVLAPNLPWHLYRGAAREDRYRTYRLGLTKNFEWEEEDLFLIDFDLSLKWGGFGEIRYLVELFYTKSGVTPDFGWSFLIEVLALPPEQRKQLQLNLKAQMDLHYERRQAVDPEEWESRISILREAQSILADLLNINEL